MNPALSREKSLRETIITEPERTAIGLFWLVFFLVVGWVRTEEIAEEDSAMQTKSIGIPGTTEGRFPSRKKIAGAKIKIAAENV